MPYTHHSHSGQFCKHAKNTLAEMFDAARASRMRVFCTTEHLPRPNPADLYPEELAAGLDPAGLTAQFEAYVSAAKQLQAASDEAAAAGDATMPHVLVGFETDWIRPEESAAVVRELVARPGVFDFFVGSVHHVATIPIDFDHATYRRARDICGGTDEALFLAYFEAQYDMLTALRPVVVGHFDLIRLLSDEPDVLLHGYGDGCVWRQVCKNLEFVRGYGGLLEINSSALRKGLEDPYPRREICQEWIRMGGEFVLSDDSHGIEQIAVKYDVVEKFLGGLEGASLVYLTRESGGGVKKNRITAEEAFGSWRLVQKEARERTR